MGYSKVKVDAQDKHIGLEADLVHGGRREGNGQADHSQQWWVRLAAVRERVLRPKVAQYEDHLKDNGKGRNLHGLVEVSDGHLSLLMLPKETATIHSLDR